MLAPAAISIDTPAKARKGGSALMMLKGLLTHDLRKLLFLLLSLLSLSSRWIARFGGSAQLGGMKLSKVGFLLIVFFFFASQPKSESVSPAVVPLIQRVLGLKVQAGRIPHSSWIPAGTWCLVGRLTYRDQNPQKSEESVCDRQVAFKKSSPRIHSEQLWIYPCRWPHIGFLGRSRCNNTSLLCTFN